MEAMVTHEGIDPGLEELTQAYGRELFARIGRGGPMPFSPAWWDDQLMNLSMADEAVKVQLFRFIDALPLLRSPAEITRHLREYFAAAGDHLPGWMRLGLRWLPHNGVTGKLLARAALTNAERLARRFIAGANLQEAIETLVKLRKRSLAATVHLLGEMTITESEADQYMNEYLELIAGLSGPARSWSEVEQIDCGRDSPSPPGPLSPEERERWVAQGASAPRSPLPRVNVSIKLSSLYSQWDPIDLEGTTRVVLTRLRPVLRAARKYGAFVWVDMEQYSYKDLTLRIFRQVLDEAEFRDWTDVGVALQVYLRDAATDLENLVHWAERRGAPVWVRLIKGAYWDYETTLAAQQDWPVPVFMQKWETDANYEKLIRYLLEHRHVLRPAIGSHNIRNLAYTLALAEQLGLPPGSFEFQFLFGMAEPIKDAMVSLGHRVRVYTPYGELLPGMAYLVRRLLENTANESFLRASFTEHVAEEQLLMNPLKRLQNAECRLQIAKPTLDGERGFKNEALTDFSREPARQAMQQALHEVGTQLGKTYPEVIANQAVATPDHIEVRNPSHITQVVGRCGKATVAMARDAVAAAKQAFPAWRDTPARDRADYLFRVADLMKRRRFELSAWEVFECGKQWREADADVAESIDYCIYYAQEMLRLAEPRRRDVPGEDNEYFYEPRGVAVIIAPWNFPLAILCGMTAAALVTGNTVIMKPAEQSPIIAAKLMALFQEAGLPAGVASYLPGVGEEVGPVLVNHPDVALITFTGSMNVGLLINRQATEMQPGQDHVKRVIAEMGGKNAIIVDGDADLDEAVQGVAASAFGYQGQKCSACSRAIVLEGIHDMFLHRLIEATRSLKIAPAEDPGCTIGPVIDDTSRQRILAAIERGKSEAKLVYAGDVGTLASEGHYVAPHIFADVPATSSLAQEEIFGPVLAVLKARDLDHALELANGTRYALTGGLYTRSPASIARVRREFRVGNLYINRKITGALVDRQPFGGFKLSGIGSKAGGPDYLLQFVLPRAITENTMRRGFVPAMQA